jgi:hypothetical protein
MEKSARRYEMRKKQAKLEPFSLLHHVKHLVFQEKDKIQTEILPKGAEKYGDLFSLNLRTSCILQRACIHANTLK